MKKHGNLFTKLILLFTVVPVIELFILFKLASYTNWLATIGLVILTGIAGAHLAKKEGRQIISEIKYQLSEGNMPGEQMVNGLCVLIGGVLLLTPGILTDAFGFTLLIPVTRSFYKQFIMDKFKKIIERGSFTYYRP